MSKQRTISKPVVIEGRGLHTGKNAIVKLAPANENEGIYFLRTDIESRPKIQALTQNIFSTQRGTTLKQNDAIISTIEHCMSAIWAMKIDNLQIEVNCEELPILDGSSKYWISLIESAGIVEQEAEKHYFRIKEPVHYISEDNKIEYIALPYEGFEVKCTIDFFSELIGTQIAEFSDKDDYKKEISNARTFVFLSEVEALIDNNLIKGGDLCNAILFAEKPLSDSSTKKIAQFFNKDIKDIKIERGIINTIKLQYPNEPARHKLLDFIGDISLISPNILGKFIVLRGGHKANALFSKQVIKQMNDKNSIPQYDPNKPPVFDIMDIKKRLPHRFPMLLIDKIIEVGEDYVVGFKNVTGNENFFNGHFPQEPVMPGVLIVEALGQTGGMLVLKDTNPEENYSTYFMKFEEVKFRNKVVPGDSLILKLSLIEPIRRGIVKMKGIAYVGNKVCVEAIMMAMVSKS